MSQRLISSEFIAKLKRFDSRERRLRSVSRLCAGAVAVLTVVGFAVVADRVFRMGPTGLAFGRFGLLTAIAGSILYTAFAALRQRTSVDIARDIGRCKPGMAEKLITLFELEQDADNANVSQALVRRSIDLIERETAADDFSDALPFSLTRRHGLLLLVATLLSGVLFLSYRPAVVNALSRLLQPGNPPEFFTYTDGIVEPGVAVLRHGDRLTVRYRSARGRPKAATVTLVETPAGAGDSALDVVQTYAMSPDRGGFALTTSPLFSDARYRVDCGDFRSPFYAVSNVICPAVTKWELRIDAPAYAQLEPGEYAPASIENAIVRGSRVAIRVTTEPAAATATATIDGEALPIAPDADGLAVVEGLAVATNHVARFKFYAAEGLSLDGFDEMSLTAVDDPTPEVFLVLDRTYAEMIVTDPIDLAATADDNFGVGSIGVDVQYAPSSSDALTFQQGGTPGEYGDWQTITNQVGTRPLPRKARVASYGAAEDWLGITESGNLRIRAWATDIGPEGERRAYSAPQRLVVLSEKDFMNQLLAKLLSHYFALMALHNTQFDLAQLSEKAAVGAEPRESLSPRRQRGVQSDARQVRGRLDDLKADFGRIGLVEGQLIKDIDHVARGLESIAAGDMEIAAKHLDAATRMDENWRPHAGNAGLAQEDAAAALLALAELLQVKKRDIISQIARQKVQQMLRQQERNLEATKEFAAQHAGESPEDLKGAEREKHQQLVDDERKIGEALEEFDQWLTESNMELESEANESEAMKQAQEKLAEGSLPKDIKSAEQKLAKNQGFQAAGEEEKVAEQLRELAETMEEAEESEGDESPMDMTLEHTLQDFIKRQEAVIASIEAEEEKEPVVSEQKGIRVEVTDYYRAMVHMLFGDELKLLPDFAKAISTVSSHLEEARRYMYSTEGFYDDGNQPAALESATLALEALKRTIKEAEAMDEQMEMGEAAMRALKQIFMLAEIIGGQKKVLKRTRLVEEREKMLREKSLYSREVDKTAREQATVKGLAVQGASETPDQDMRQKLEIAASMMARNQEMLRAVEVGWESRELQMEIIIMLEGMMQDQQSKMQQSMAGGQMPQLQQMLQQLMGAGSNAGGVEDPGRRLGNKDMNKDLVKIRARYLGGTGVAADKSLPAGHRRVAEQYFRLIMEKLDQ